MPTAKIATVAASSQGTEAQDRPLLDKHNAALNEVIAKGKERGYVTYGEVSAVLPQDQVSSEQIEDVMAMLYFLRWVVRKRARCGYAKKSPAIGAGA